MKNWLFDSLAWIMFPVTIELSGWWSLLILPVVFVVYMALALIFKDEPKKITN